MTRWGLVGAWCTLLLAGACTLLVDTGDLVGPPISPEGGTDGAIEAGPTDWVDPAWAARRAIVVPAGKTLGVVEDFELLVDLDALDSGARPRDDGLDIRFTAGDAKTPLAHELVSPRTAWVKVPRLVDSAETRFYVYYANPAFADRAPPGSVWDGRFEAVWHLDEHDGPYLDSTSHHQDGSGNTVSFAPGKVGGAAHFGGSSQIAFPVVAAIGITSTYSVSAWALSETATDAAIADGSIGLHLTLERQSSGGFDAIAYEGCGSPNWPANKVGGTKQTSVGAWFHAVVATDGTDVTTYVDGIRDGQRTLSQTKVTNVYDFLKLGLPTCGNDGFHGAIDEVRITRRVLDDTWVRAEYENQSSPSTFAIVQAEERR